jgi:ATP-binding cassette subfamily B multidrug efflux pump
LDENVKRVLLFNFNDNSRNYSALVKELIHLNKYFWKYKKLLLTGALFILLSKIFAVFQAPLVRKSLNLIVKKFNSEDADIDFLSWELAEYAMYMVLAAVISGLFLYLTRQTIIVMSRLMEFDIKNEIFEHYQTLPLSFYRKNSTGDLMSRISEDVGKVRMYLGPGVMYGISLVVICVTVISTMLSVNTQLTLIVLTPLPFLSITIYFVSNKLNKQSEQIQKEMAGLSTFTQEAFSGMRVLKAFVREEHFIGKMAKQSDSYKKHALKMALLQSTFFPTIILLIGLSTLLTVYFGGIISINSENFTAGNIAEFMLYLSMLTWPVTSIGWVTSIIQSASASQKRINEFLNTKTEITFDAENEVNVNGNIEFKNVSLVYPESGITALDKVSFSIKSGETVAIVGNTGSGKSSLAALLCRNYDPTSGKILIEGEDLKSINLHHFREQLGYVPQDAFLFSDTIRQNLLFGKEEATEEEIIEATKNAAVYENINGFKNGFDTILGERGITLSGGQKQRLTIARALIKDPKLLILDDSLSAIDTDTENIILNKLKKLMQNRTSLIISHRISSVKLANKILVLHDGQLAEQGSHDELMLLNGHYFRMYEKQHQVDGK